MFNPKYQILLTSKCFPEDGVIGLGAQLILIVDILKEVLPKHVWYAADVEAVGINAMASDFNSHHLNRVGSDLEFIQYCSTIDQFIWGVFVCIDTTSSSQIVQGIELYAESEQFRPIECDKVLLEIRAFDTTFFAIYSEDRKILEYISGKFNQNADPILNKEEYFKLVNANKK